MNEVLKRIDALLKERNTTMYKLCKHTGIAQSTSATWFSKDRVPKSEQLALIADYLGTTTDFLLTGESLSLNDENTIENLTHKYTNELLTVGTLYLDDGKIEIPEEDRADLAIGIEAAVTAALLAYKKRKG